MVCIKTQYLHLNKILLLAIGLWPYQQSRFTRFQFVFLCAILMTCIILQLTTFMTKKYTSDIIATVLSFVTTFIIFTLKYYTFGVKIESVKKMFIKLQHVCNELKDKNEIAIIEKYGYISKCYTVGLTVIGICGIYTHFAIQFWSTPNVILPTNISRSRRIKFVTEYFVEILQEKYFLLIQLHVHAAICIGVTTIIATGTILIAYFQFICGMLEISSYRIQSAMKTNSMQNITITTSKNKILRSEDLICAINIHREAMKLCKRVLYNFEIMYFCLIQMFVISLCFNYVRIFQVVSSEKNIQQAILPLMFAICHILYLFIANSIGQNLTDLNNDVFATVYRIEWYVTPLHIQRMILFLLLKGAKNFTVSLGGIIYPSLECFTTLVKASVSYFTVILSTQ